MSNTSAANSAVECTLGHIETTAGAHHFKVTLHNRSTETIHLLRTDRMPYVLQTDDDGVALAWSIQAPHPELDYFALEIPMTEALTAGSSKEESVQLARPIQVRDHLAGRGRDPDRTLADPLIVRAVVGYVAYSLGKRERATAQYRQVLADQVLCESAPLSVGD